MFRPADLFDLTEFAHHALFDGIEFSWQALDRLPEYLSAHLEPRVLGEVAPGAVIRGPVFIGIGTVVESGAMIIGPAIIGEDCEIRHCAYLRGAVLIGDRCVVGHCSEVKSSILLNDAKAPHFNYVGDSILGSQVNLGAGAILANLRLDGREVFARPHEERYPRVATGRRKLGAILGDGARIGCNVVLNPGAIVGREIAVPPHSRQLSRELDAILAAARANRSA